MLINRKIYFIGKSAMGQRQQHKKKHEKNA